SKQRRPRRRAHLQRRPALRHALRVTHVYADSRKGDLNALSTRPSAVTAGAPEQLGLTVRRVFRVHSSIPFFVGCSRSFVGSGHPGASGVAVIFLPLSWLWETGRPRPRDDSATHWDT